MPLAFVAEPAPKIYAPVACAGLVDAGPEGVEVLLGAGTEKVVVTPLLVVVPIAPR